MRYLLSKLNGLPFERGEANNARTSATPAGGVGVDALPFTEAGGGVAEADGAGLGVAEAPAAALLFGGGVGVVVEIRRKALVTCSSNAS